MNPLALKSFLAAAALLVPGAVGTAYMTGALDAAEAEAQNHAQALFGGVVLDSWSGDAAEAVETGSLDLRTVTGNVYVALWDRPAYEVTILAAEAGDGQQIGDAAIEGVFEEKASESDLGLALLVRESGTLGMDVNRRDQIAVVAFVPDLAWTTVLACSGGAPSALDAAWDPVWYALFGEEDDRKTCVDSPTAIGGNINVDHEDDGAKALRVPFALDGLRGGEALLFASYADVRVDGARFGSIEVATAYGNVLTNATTADTLVLASNYGNLMMAATDAKSLDAITQYGNVALATAVAGEAAARIVSEYGNVRVIVPHAEDRAYSVTAATEYGNIRIRLPGVASDGETDAKDSGSGASRNLLPALVQVEGPEAGRSRESFKGATEGFEAYADRLTLDIETQYGNILAAAAGAEEAEEEETDDEA